MAVRTSSFRDNAGNLIEFLKAPQDPQHAATLDQQGS